MVTHGLTSVRAYCADLLRYTNAETVTEITRPAFVTDNETDEVSPGQGKILFDHSPAAKSSARSQRQKAPRGTVEVERDATKASPSRAPAAAANEPAKSCHCSGSYGTAGILPSLTSTP